MNKPSTPYFRGARAALAFGPYLSVIFLSLVMQLPLLQDIGSILILALPVTTAIFLRRSFRASGYRYSFSELWVEGITMYLFACAICGLVTMIYLKLIDPGILMRLSQDLIDQLRQAGTPEHLQMARMLSNAAKEGVLINATSFVVSMFWLTMAIGSLTSMIMAALVRIGRPGRDLSGVR